MPSWSALIICFTALMLNTLREKATLKWLILHSICTSLFFPSALLNCRQPDVTIRVMFLGLRKAVCTVRLLDLYKIMRLMGNMFLKKSWLLMKKVLKSCLLHSIDMFWLASHFRGPTAPYIGMSCFLFTLWRKCAHYGTISNICQNKSLQKYRKVKHLKALLLARSEVRITPAWLHWDLILRPVGHQAHGQLCELLSVNGPRCGWVFCCNAPFQNQWVMI